MNKIQELQKQIDELQSEINNLKNSKGLWKPEIGQKYWTNAGEQKNFQFIWNNDAVDKNNLLLGDVFETEQELENHKVLPQAIQKLKEYSFKPDWNDKSQEKWSIYYNHLWKKFDFFYASYRENINHIYFPTKEIAEQAFNILTGGELNSLKS